MIKLRWLAMLIGVASAATLHAADAPRCSFTGSWLGYAPNTAKALVWMGEVSGASNAAGTLTTEDPSESATLNGVFPDAVRTTALRGVWERVDGRTLAYTLIGMAVNVDGRVVWINKKSGYATLSADCAEMTVVGVQQAYLPSEDPYKGIPLKTYGLADRTAKRMPVYSPYPAP